MRRDDAKSAARLNPKFMTYEKIRKDRMEVEIEKGNTKIRYSLMWKDEDGDDDIDASEPLDLEAGVINYGKVRATNLPTCLRLIDPRPGNANQEASLEGTKEKLMQVVDEYVKEQMDKNKTLNCTSTSQITSVFSPRIKNQRSVSKTSSFIQLNSFSRLALVRGNSLFVTLSGPGAAAPFSSRNSVSSSFSVK